MAMTGHCSSCTGFLPDGARFCPACGQPVTGIEMSGALEESIGQALSTELRHITVVFCDLVGSTELSSTTDAEEYSDLIQAYQQQAVTIVRELGGDVEGYSGDGILFRFGWPQAHEDDAALALTAALNIVGAVGRLEESRRLVIRVGVHSGPVVVGVLGGADRPATMAVGETVNVAARLQALAEPGTVVASAAALASVEDVFNVTPLGQLRLRGVTEPVEGFRVDGSTGFRARTGWSLHRSGPLIGRDDELHVLTRLWNQARAGHGGTVLISGDPGVGKSRLALQFRDLAEADDPLWMESSCSAYTRMSVLRPVIEMMEDALEFHTDTDPAWRLERIQAVLDEAGENVDDNDELVATLLGVPGLPALPISRELRLERTTELMVAWVVGFSRRRPVVLCIEDLHWCDPTTLDVIDRLVQRIARSPVLVLLTARPEFVAKWNDRGSVTDLALEPLDDADVRALIETLGDGRRMPEQVVDSIVVSSAGIPLYVEEVGRSVLESGLLVSGTDSWDLVSPLMDLEIPETLQASVLARLDGLGPAKAVAQLAAVLGREFSLDLLVTVSGMDPELLTPFLARVVASGLILDDSAHRAGEFQFKHALVQEVTYESLLRKNRRTIHERVARVMDGQIAEGASTAFEVVARHFEAAGLPREAATHYQLAARKAAERSGHRESIAFLRQGIALARELTDITEARELEVEMQLALGSSIATRSYSDPDLAAAYDRARELCELLGNDQRVGQTLAGLAVFYINRGEITLGAELAERVLGIAATMQDDLLEVLGRVQLSLARSWQGRPTESLEQATRALAVYHPGRHMVLGKRFGTDQGVAAHVFAGWQHLLLGHLDRGLSHLQEAVDLADSIGQPFNRVYAMAFLATGHEERGESAETLHYAARARYLAEEQEFALWAGLSGVWEAAERVIAEGDHAALADVVAAGSVAAETGNRGGSTNVLARVAEAARAAGDRSMAQGLIDMALAVSEETGQPWWDPALLRLQAELLFEEVTSGDAGDLLDQDHPWARAEAAWRRSLELAEQFRYPVHGARAAAGYAGLLQRTGRVDEGRALLADWYAKCTEGRDTPVLVTVRSQLETLGGLPTD